MNNSSIAAMRLADKFSKYNFDEIVRLITDHYGPDHLAKTLRTAHHQLAVLAFRNNDVVGEEIAEALWALNDLAVNLEKMGDMNGRLLCFVPLPADPGREEPEE